MQQWSLSLGNTFDIFFLECQSRRLTESTLTFYQSRLRRFIAWCSAQDIHNLHQLTALHIRLYLLSLQERELSSYSQHAAARAIKTFLNFCVDEGLLAESAL